MDQAGAPVTSVTAPDERLEPHAVDRDRLLAARFELEDLDVGLRPELL